MTLLDEAVYAKRLDTRVLERNLSRGVLDMNDFEEAVKNLPDDSENAYWSGIGSLSDGEKDSGRD